MGKILEGILEKYDVKVINGYSWNTVAGSFEHGNEVLGSIRAE
jgi:hypothetical protein